MENEYRVICGRDSICVLAHDPEHAAIQAWFQTGLHSYLIPDRVRVELLG